MPFVTEKRQGICNFFGWTFALPIALALLLFAGPSANLLAQVPKSASPPANAGPAAIVDPLGRETPRGTVMGVLKYAERHDFATGARYLQPPSGQDMNMVQLAKEFQALHSRFK